MHSLEHGHCIQSRKGHFRRLCTNPRSWLQNSTFNRSDQALSTCSLACLLWNIAGSNTLSILPMADASSLNLRPRTANAPGTPLERTKLHGHQSFLKAGQKQKEKAA